jgi:hypothetical protein
MQEGLRLIIGSVGHGNPWGMHLLRHFGKKGIACPPAGCFHVPSPGGYLHLPTRVAHTQLLTQPLNKLRVSIGLGPTQAVMHMGHRHGSSHRHQCPQQSHTIGPAGNPHHSRVVITGQEPLHALLDLCNISLCGHVFIHMYT